MKRQIAVLGGAAVAALGMARPVQAQITASQSGGISNAALPTTNWGGSNAGPISVFQTGQYAGSDSGGTTNDPDSWGGGANGVNGYGALAEAFTVNQSGNLASAQVVLAGSTGSFSVELYDLGTPQSGYQSASGSPGQIQQINGIGGAVGAGSGGTYNGGPNLLTAGDNFTFYGSSADSIVTLDFAETVPLSTGQLYVLSLDPTAAVAGGNAVSWLRGGLPAAAYNTGEGLNADGVAGMQTFEGKTSVRNLDAAIQVPEPTSIALVSIAAVGLMARRRSKTA